MRRESITTDQLTVALHEELSDFDDFVLSAPRHCGDLADSAAAIAFETEVDDQVYRAGYRGYNER